MIVDKIRINYYNSSNVLTYIDVEIDKNDYLQSSVMGESELYLNFSLPYYIEFPVNTTYVEYRYKISQAFTIYYLFSNAQPKKLNSENFKYSLKFEQDQAKLKNWIIRNIVDNRIKFSITSTPLQMLQLIVDNLNQRDSGWQVGQCIEAPQKTISFSSTYIQDGLQAIADIFETEYYFYGKIVNIGKEEYNLATPLSLSYGSGYGIKPIIDRKNTERKIIGKLFVQGGEKNIDSTTYGSRNLLLPADQIIYYNGVSFSAESNEYGSSRQYKVDSSGLYITRNVTPLISSNEDSQDLTKIYPKREGTISLVITNERIHNPNSAYVPTPNHDVPLYDVVDNSIPSTLDYSAAANRLDGQTISIIFQSGDLAGREFEISEYVHTTRTFKIVPITEDGQTFPNPTFAPQINDKYIVIGCNLPNAYIRDDAMMTGASWEMFKEAVKYLWEREALQVQFNLPLDSIWLKSTGNEIRKGDYINFIDADLCPEGLKIRVMAVKQNLFKPYEQELTLSNVRTERRTRRNRHTIDTLDENIDRFYRDVNTTIVRREFATNTNLDTERLRIGVLPLNDLGEERDVANILGQAPINKQIFGSSKSLESDVVINAKKINTKNKRLTTLVDEKDKSLLSFFSDSKEPISVTPKIDIDGNILILTEPQVVFDYNKTTSYQLEAQEIDLDLTDIQYIYAVCDTDTYNGTLKAYNSLQPFEDIEHNKLRNYLIGYVNPVIDEIPSIEYTYLGDKAIPEIKVETINFPPIPIVVGERSKFISHRLGYYPNIGIRQENGVITQVGINHISDQECEITWQGDLTGVVIIDY